MKLPSSAGRPRAVYANEVEVSLSHSELVLEFLTVAPPTASVVARILVQPERLREMLETLKNALDAFEDQGGTGRASIGFALPNQ